MSTTALDDAVPQNPPATAGLFSRLDRRRPRPAAAAIAAATANDREHGVCLDLEAAMMAIIVAGAALFGAGLLRYGVAAAPAAAAGARALQAIAIAAAAFALWSVLSGLVGLARLARPPAR